VVLLLLAGRFGALADRHGPRLYLAVGPALLGAGTLLFTLVTSRGTWYWLAIGSGIFALGLAVTVAPITAAALSSAPERFAGIAAGVNNTVSRVGALIAVAVVGAVIAAAYSGPGEALADGSAHDASVHAFRLGMLVAAGLAFGGALVGALGVPGRSRSRSRPGTLEDRAVG
jgi:MFS family permease